jgi:precorrin-6x reductase
VLLTTGSKDLSAFVAAMRDFRERLYVRILPMRASLDIVERVGIPMGHVIAMQGPFSERMNKVLIEEFKIAMLVTKQSGVTGGFGEKVRAARACGIELVVIERPEARAGMPLEDVRDLLRSRYGL